MFDTKVWVIGDLHLGHKNVIRLCNRPFTTTEEMNEEIIARWNKVVKQDDKVFMLGDFALWSRTNIIEYGQRLKGAKTLIMGNHDTHSIKTYYAAGFEVVSKYPIIYEGYYILSHEPQYIKPDSLYANIHAHVHHSKDFEDCTNLTFCASAERINYTPVSFKTIKERMAIAPKLRDNLTFCVGCTRRSCFQCEQLAEERQKNEPDGKVDM